MIDDEVIETFVRGLCFTRSFTHPYVAEKIDRIWVMRDGPRTRGDSRNEEWVASDLEPGVIDQVVRKHSRGKFAVCAIQSLGESHETVKAGFKALGYRLTTTEPLMVHHLKRVPNCKSAASIQRVTEQSLADKLSKAARSRQILPEHFRPDSLLRQYVAMIGDDIVGWVRSITTGESTWCSSMYVEPPSRRQGIGRALLCRMLRDDRSAGATMAVLLASHTGAKLYPVVGYEQIGTLLLFTPRRA